jgi:hypothetical protein
MRELGNIMRAGEYILSPGANYSKRWDLYQCVEDVAWVLIQFFESSPEGKVAVCFKTV